MKPFTEEEQKKVSEWSLYIRQKHSVPENYRHMIDRASIDEYIKWSETSDFIFVYDELGTICKCSYGRITYMLSETYGKVGDNSKKRVDAWKSAMRVKYDVPPEYEIVMNYGMDNNVDRWIAYCEARDAVSAKDNIHAGIFWFFQGGKKEYMPTEYEFNYWRTSDYHVAEDGSGIKQEESDCVAHFFQIIHVIKGSSWYQARSLYQENMNGDGQVRADMPSLEQTVFALLYMRQLIGCKGNDDLLNFVCQCYIKHAEDPIKSEFVKQYCSRWNNLLQGKPMKIKLAKIVSTNQMLLETFLYGSLIVHSPNKVKSKIVRDLFKKIAVQEGIRVSAIFELNSIMKTLFSEALNIANLLQEDFTSWINEKKIPAPDIMQQEYMFQWLPTVKKQESDNTNRPPQFGVPFNIEIKEAEQ